MYSFFQRLHSDPFHPATMVPGLCRVQSLCSPFTPTTRRTISKSHVLSHACQHSLLQTFHGSALPTDKVQGLRPLQEAPSTQAGLYFLLRLPVPHLTCFRGNLSSSVLRQRGGEGSPIAFQVSTQAPSGQAVRVPGLHVLDLLSRSPLVTVSSSIKRGRNFSYITGLLSEANRAVGGHCLRTTHAAWGPQASTVGKP